MLARVRYGDSRSRLCEPVALLKQFRAEAGSAEKIMASAFAKWEMDPFFAAAEDVQQSADRMESAYRAWMHKRNLAEEAAVDQNSVEISRRELRTALDTTKWQLEEFRKAVTEAFRVHSHQMGEAASKRHFSFIDAIQDQIYITETAFSEFSDVQSSTTLQSIDFNSDERDQLAMFLSSYPSKVHPLDNGPNCPVGETSNVPSEPHDLQESTEFVKQDSATNFPSIQGSYLSSTSHGFKDKDLEVEHKPCNEIVEVDAISAKTANEQKVMLGSLNHDQNSWHCLTSAECSNKKVTCGKPAALSKHDRFQHARNGFKRWKNSSRDENTKATNGEIHYDIEEATYKDDARSYRKNMQSRGKWAWTVQQLVFATFVAFRNPSSRKSAGLVLGVCLCCMYFWSLSGLVPYISTMVPG